MSRFTPPFRSLLAGGVSIWLLAGATPAAAETCARADFEGVVNQAAAVLRDLTQQTTGPFQAKLRTLKDKRGWNQQQFVKDGAQFVRDERIIEFDEKSEDLLARINGAGASGQGEAATGDCNLLADLKANMAALVEAQKTKWTYMFAKIDEELAK